MDLRIPSGYFFALLGAILLGLGLFSPGTARLTSINVNLYSGIVIFAFAAVLLFLAQRARRRARR